MKQLALIAILFLFVACVKQPAPDTVVPDTPTASIETMVIGIDKFETEKTWALNTDDGTFVVGPEVHETTKAELHERLLDAHEHMVVITYTHVPASKGRLAHRRVISVTTFDKELVLSRPE